MIVFKIHKNNIVSVEADRAYCNLSELLCDIATNEFWTEEVSLGCTLVDNVEIHYLKRDAYPNILLHLYQFGYNVFCKHVEDDFEPQNPPTNQDVAPVNDFEPPANQEETMDSGYDSGSQDDSDLD